MRTRKVRRGSTLVMVAIMLVAFVGVGAISADVARYFVVTGELQTAADAAALRGAMKLAATPGATPEAIVDAAVVAFVAAANRADGQGLTVSDTAVQMAFYTPGVNGAQGTISYALAGRRPNAVTVNLRAAPKGVFSQLLGLTGAVNMNRAATAWVAHLGSNCVRPWAFPYRGLYATVSGIANPPTPAPDLDPAKYSEFLARDSSQRMFTVLGQNQVTALSNDGEWNGFNFTGNAGKASFVDGIQGCTSTKINPDAGEGVTLPGQANQYVNWSDDAVNGGGNGNNRVAGICVKKSATDAGCYQTATSTQPGVTINSAWGELLGNGSNGINFNYVGEFVVKCFYTASTETCPYPEPGTPATGYPPGTIVGFFQQLKSRYITPDDVVGNFSGNIIHIMLVK
jgi:hypothetical protein